MSEGTTVEEASDSTIDASKKRVGNQLNAQTGRFGEERKEMMLGTC